MGLQVPFSRLHADFDFHCLPWVTMLSSWDVACDGQNHGSSRDAHHLNRGICGCLPHGMCVAGGGEEVRLQMVSRQLTAASVQSGESVAERREAATWGATRCGPRKAQAAAAGVGERRRPGAKYTGGF